MNTDSTCDSGRHQKGLPHGFAGSLPGLRCSSGTEPSGKHFTAAADARPAAPFSTTMKDTSAPGAIGGAPGSGGSIWLV